jgi:hypothetical protein
MIFGNWNWNVMLIIVATAIICGVLIGLAFDLPAIFIRNGE